MLFFLSFIILNGLQLKLQLYDYQKGDINYTAYSVSIKVAGSNYQMVIDNINPYSLIYSKNHINNYQCIHCPSIKSDNFEKFLISESTTLQNSNKCLLTKNENKLNIKIRISCWINFHQICLTYDISNQKQKQQLVLILTQLIVSQNKSNLFYYIFIKWILTKKNNKLLQLKTRSIEIQFQLFYNDIQFLKKKIIKFDLKTKSNYLPQISSNRQNPIKKLLKLSISFTFFFLRNQETNGPIQKTRLY
ncbi:unnamed protein product [Paramecium primaurelia]|uniref:Transmembrane protein n=1 Tax=Paramecium primaurelia TaxID=5886 RepID=A0A8S1JQE7_PARPR|nr:unnamed protein product [Paramecium primaurelia]